MKKLLIIVFMTIVFSVAGLWAINHYNFVGGVPTGKVSAINAVPQSASFILEVDDLSTVEAKLAQLSYGKLLRSNNYYERLMKRAQQFTTIQSTLLLKGAPSNFSPKTIISTHIISGRDYDFLTVIPEYGPGRKAVLNTIEGSGCESTTIYLGVNVYCYKPEGAEQKFYIANNARQWLISSSAILVEDAIKKLDYATQLNSKDPFQQLQTARSENTDLTLYMNAEQAPLLLAMLVNEETFSGHKQLATAMDWLKMDIDLQADKIIFNGKASVSGQKWLSNWKSRPEAEYALWENLRVPSATLSVYNLNDFKGYASTVESSGKDALPYLKPWMGSQWAVSTREPKEEILIVSLSDQERAISALSELHKIRSGARVDISNFQDSSKVNKLDIATPLNEVFMTHFDALTSINTAITKHYIIFGQAPSEVIRIAGSAVRAGGGKTTLSGGNVKLFVHPKKTRALLHNAIQYGALDKDMVTKWSNELGEVSLKFNRSGSGYNAQGVLTFGAIPRTQKLIIEEESIEVTPETATVNKVEQLEGFKPKEVGDAIEENETVSDNGYIVWEKDFGKKVIGSVSVLKNHRTDQKILAVQTHDNLLHVLDRNGKELFSYDAGQRLLSPVYQLDYFKNGKLQMVFNTSDQLHMVDILGRKVKVFPLQLPSKATGPLEVVDYDKQKNYRLFVPTAKGFYGYRYSGQKLPGWAPNSNPGSLELALQHFLYDGKDYLVATNTAGEVFLMNRKGELRVPKAVTGKTFTTPFKVDTSVKPYRLVGKSNAGVTYTVSLEGTLRQEKISASVLANAGSGNSLSSTSDFLGSGEKVRINVDGNKVVVRK